MIREQLKVLRNFVSKPNFIGPKLPSEVIDDRSEAGVFARALAEPECRSLERIAAFSRGLRQATVALIGFVAWVGSHSASLAADAELVEVKKIWDAAPHNAFTDLVRYRDQWICVFREGSAHVSPEGALRVIVSPDGSKWNSAALITSTNGDLRDAKITITPAGTLMLSGAVALRQPAQYKHRSLAWFSEDGYHWSEPVVIGDPNMWLWRTTWWQGTAYSIGYETAGENFVRLYTSKDGRRFDVLVPTLFGEGEPNETSIVFDPDATAFCLLRRDGQLGSGKLGIARPPYTNWEWKDLWLRIGGPHLLRLPDGRLVAAARLSNGPVRTSLCWVDRRGKLTEFLKLPSGGDSSYAGVVWHNDLLWVSYYSSHEGKASIYLAKVRLPSEERK